jgi:hypothetical protein
VNPVPNPNLLVESGSGPYKFLWPKINTAKFEKDKLNTNFEYKNYYISSPTLQNIKFPHFPLLTAISPSVESGSSPDWEPQESK